jgi:(p)ppGpp synthase/HD superfamily hydrolase
MDNAKLLSAMMFAATAHKNQKRKGDGNAPYINHLIEVASLISNIAQEQDIDILQTAILHDVLEDTRVSEADIQQAFGLKVLSYVKALSDDKSLSLDERQTKQLSSVKLAEPAIKLIKLADHISNVSSIPPDWSKAKLSSYLTWSNEVANACFGVSGALATEYKLKLTQAQTLLKLKSKVNKK